MERIAPSAEGSAVSLHREGLTVSLDEWAKYLVVSTRRLGLTNAPDEPI